MASLPAPTPTPQPQQQHVMATAASPSNANSQLSYAPPVPTPSGYGMSFDSSFPGSQPQTYPRHIAGGAAYSRSFGDYPTTAGPVVGGGVGGSVGRGPVGGGFDARAQIYTAVYSGVSVYEMEIQGIACMRRRSDGWLNATQILKVAGVDKGKRTKVLEKEILTGEHEKVQGGYGKYQGTWISYKRGREFCRQYGVEDILRPLLDYDVSSDGSGGQGQGQQETPTKEQAMAANRKRFYTTSVENARAGGGSGGGSGPMTNGTFFSNISPSASVVLAAMNKAARINSPAPRPGGMRRPSQSDAFPGGSQQSLMSEASFTDTKYIDSGYGTQPNGEPPRKRLRPDSQDGGMAPSLPLDASMRSVTPTEPNESFVYDGPILQDLQDLPSNGTGEPVALPPLPNPATETEHDKSGLILDLFAEAGRTDYTNHPALSQLSGEDFNIPLDASANNALHWAATLAKVSLLKLLIQKGANIYRGNAAGQSPLISAVLVNNCWEHSSFPDLLELLGPLIEIRDLQGRTILHHIAVSSGIKGRAASSKYYLEALLEFLVRIGNSSSNTAADAASFVASSQDATGTPVPTAPVVQSAKGPVTLVRFLSHIVNARDKAGNTALNLVARVGNRSIIQQLIEIHADPSLPNYKGVSAKDFGVGVESHGGAAYMNGNGTQGSENNHMPSSFSKSNLAGLPASSTQDTTLTTTAAAASGEEDNSQAEDIGQDVLSSLTTLLNQSLASHKDLLRLRTQQIDDLNAEIRESSALHQREAEKLQVVRERVKAREERLKRIEKLKGRIAEMKARAATGMQGIGRKEEEEVEPAFLNDDQALEILNAGNDDDEEVEAEELSPEQQATLLALLPPATTLKHLNQTYKTHNAALQHRADELRARSAELEAMYRKVVSLCTGVEEARLEADEGALLGSLLRAVESERGSGTTGDGNGMGHGGAEGEVGRVREFLRRVDGGVVGGGLM